MTAARAVVTKTDFFRLQPNLSMAQETMASIMDTEEVRAAKATVRKNRMPTQVPMTVPISPKTLGSATNISAGPLADMPSRPIKVYTAGMIIMPAIKATMVSNSSIWLTDLLISVCFFT